MGHDFIISGSFIPYGIDSLEQCALISPKNSVEMCFMKKKPEIRKSEFLKKLYKRNFHRGHGEMIVCITATDLHQDI